MWFCRIPLLTLDICDRLGHGNFESFQYSPVVRKGRPYHEGERYERLSRRLKHRPHDVELRECWPSYDRSQSQYHDYSVSYVLE